MLTAELDFDLPPHLIAQEPVEPRDHARLMVIERAGGALRHCRVHDLPALLRPDDLLIFNDTRVLHARLHGHKEASGGQVEALLLREHAVNVWEALLKPSARLRLGIAICFERGAVTARATPLERTASGWLIRFEREAGADIRDLLPSLGEMPTPPYIKRHLHDAERYQTMFARRDSRRSTSESTSQQSTSDQSTSHEISLDSAAAPTAGLHFTPRLLEALRERGIGVAFVTLGVGVGTFRPVQAATLEEHRMHREDFEVPAATTRVIATQRERGGRVVAVGTTTVRVLESVADTSGHVPTGAAGTEIFIRPGYRFRCVDALLTNFHLPRSTLLAMVGAFAGMADGTDGTDGTDGLSLIHRAYEEAIRREYRFFSFGDAMLIE